MYDLPYHKESNPEVIREFIEKHPFAFLSGCNAENQPVATQVPAFYEEREGGKYLSGHIMKGTDHHKAFDQNDQVLVVLSGPHSYVSGSWYSDPHIPSTWNYMCVHCKGKIRFLDGEAIADMLRKTSMHFEDNNPDSPTVYDHIPERYKEMAMKSIVAFEIKVEEINTVFKLSQDRDEQSFKNIIAKLREQGDNGRELAMEMEKRAGQLFR